MVRMLQTLVSAVADKINLSNSTEAESQDAEIAAEGNNVIVTW